MRRKTANLIVFVLTATAMGEVFAVRDAINPFEGLGLWIIPLFIIGGTRHLLLSSINQYPIATFLITLVPLAISGWIVWLLNSPDKPKNSVNNESLSPVNDNSHTLPQISPSKNTKKSLWRALPWSILILSFLNIAYIALLSYNNYRVYRYVENHDYKDLRSYLNDCSSCDIAVTLDDWPFFKSSVTASEKESMPIEIRVALCNSGIECKNFRGDLAILQTYDEHLIDDYFAGKGRIYSGWETTKIIQRLVATGELGILTTLAKYEQLWAGENSTDPTHSLLNIALHSSAENQREVFFFLMDEAARGNIQNTVPPAYFAIARSYREKSVQPLAEKNIGKQDLLAQPKQIPTDPEDVFYISPSPILFVLGWPYKEGWLKGVVDYAGISFPELLKEATERYSCKEGVRLLVRGIPEFGKKETLIRKYCHQGGKP